MAKTQIGAVIGIEGAREYNQAISDIVRVTKQMESEIKVTESTFKKEYRTIQDVKNLKEKLQIAIGGYTQKLSLQTDAQKEMNTQLDIEERRSRLLPERIANLTRAGEEYKENLEAVKKEYQENQDKIERLTKSTVNMGTAINDTTAEINELQKQLDELKGENGLTLFLKGWEESTSKTGEAFKQIGGTLTKSVTLPIIGGMVGAVKVAGDFESAFTGVRKTVEGTDEELAVLKDLLMDIPLVTASTTEEVMGVAEAAGQLNVPLESIADFTKTIIMLGDSTNVSAEEGATSIARFMNIMGVNLKEGTEDVDRFGSSLVALGNNTATDEASILALAMRLASAGKLAKLSTPEILGLSAAMSAVGLTAEAGGTAMSTTMNLITKDVAEGGENLEKFAKVAGTTAEEFAKTWRENPIEALQELLIGMSTLSENGGAELLEFMDEVGWSGIRQSDTMRRLSSDYDGVSEAVRIANENFKTNEESLDGVNALTEEAEKRYGDLNSKISEFKESVKQLAAAFGEEILPVLKPIVDNLTEMIKGFAGLDEKTKKNILAFAGLFAVIGPVLSIGGNLLIWTAKLKGAFGALKGAEAIGGVTSALGGGAAGGGLLGSLETMASTITDKVVPAVGGETVGGGLTFALGSLAFMFGGAKAAATEMDKKMYESAEACEYVATRYHWSEEKVNQFGYTWDANGHLVELSTQEMVSVVESEHADLLQDVDAMKNTWRTKAQEMAKNQTKAIADETPRLQETTHKMVKTAVEDEVTSTASRMTSYGAEVASNFANGISSNVGIVARAASWIASTVSSYLHFSEPDVGALSNFHTYMPDMMKTMATGIKDNMYMVENALGSLTGKMANQLNGGQSYNYGGVNIILNVPQGANGYQMVDEIENALAQRTIRRKAVFG